MAEQLNVDQGIGGLATAPALTQNEIDQGVFALYDEE